MGLGDADLKKSVDEWQAVYQKNLKGLKSRKYSFRIHEKRNIASALIGVRRSGKTFAAIEAAKKSGFERVFYFNFEDPLFTSYGTAMDLDRLISVYSEYHNGTPEFVIFDEIQNVPGWEKWARKATDMGLYQLVITGSSAKMLSSEIATALSGRCLEKKVWPLSFVDFLQFGGVSCRSSDDYLGYFREYMHWGGFPDVVLSGDESFKKELLRQYLSDIVMRDIMSRNEIRNKRTLDQITNYYFTNLSSCHSATAVKNAFQTNIETVQNYTKYLEDAFLVFEVCRFHRNLKVQSRDPKKIYVIDTGLRNVNTRTSQEETGRLVENIVFIELMRCGVEVYYFKETQETDFLITEHGTPVSAIQVCDSNMENTKTEQREINGLLECLRKTGLKNGLILTRSREEKIKIETFNIEMIPVYKWLLNENKTFD